MKIIEKFKALDWKKQVVFGFMALIAFFIILNLLLNALGVNVQV